MNAQTLAAEFRLNLEKCLGGKLFKEVLVLNSGDPDMRICHSHDFIDANEVMAESFQKVIGREIESNSDEDAAVWNSAWAIFRKETV